MGFGQHSVGSTVFYENPEGSLTLWVGDYLVTDSGLSAKLSCCCCSEPLRSASAAVVRLLLRLLRILLPPLLPLLCCCATDEYIPAAWQSTGILFYVTGIPTALLLFEFLKIFFNAKLTTARPSRVTRPSVPFKW